MRDKQKRRRDRTWAEAARMVLENYSDAPMTPKQILNVIEAEGLKETRVGTSPLACLNAMLHSNSRTREALFYKLPGRISLFTMKKNAQQWSRVVSLPEDGDTEDTADEEGSQWNEASSVTAVDTSCNASCSREIHGRETRSLMQINKQKRRTGVLLPRVVLTPLKVNGAHLPSTSGSSSHCAEGESTSSRSIGASLSLHRRAALSRDNPHHLRGIRSTTTGQVKKNKGEEIDFETPGSILVNTNLRALINVRTFNALPPSLQQQLLLLLPEVDRQVSPDGQTRMSGSALNNEFFAHACQRWRERLAEGEFTPEAQLRMRQEMDKEKKVEDWKEKFFEEFYGQKLGLSVEPLSDNDEGCVTPVSKSIQPGGQRRNSDAVPKEKTVPEVRIRTRRSAFKKEEKEEDCKESHSGVAEIKASSSPLPEKAEPEIPVLEAQVPPKDEGNLPTTSERVPDLHPETSEQKRKNSEPESSNPSLEKKPRIDQRQSFRNTIQSVHTEKPQPTKEEPKVPPIRIQLSRIKPPWLGKGLPAYKICPRIIPNTDPIGCWTTTCSSSDCKASHHQSQTSIGGGGGPGGGGSNSKGRSWSRNPKRRRSSKRRQRKQYSNYCRTQLLPPSYLRNDVEKPAVPLDGIRTFNTPNSCFESEGQGAVRGAFCNAVGEPVSEAKDLCTTEASISEILCDPVQGYGELDAVKPLILQSPLEDVLTLEPEVEPGSNKGKNIELGSVYKKGAATSEHAESDTITENIKSFSADTLTSVLGDVSNTFQNKFKPVTLKAATREPSNSKSDSMDAAEQLQCLAPEPKEPNNLSLAILQTIQTSLPGHLVEMCPTSIEPRENKPHAASGSPCSGLVSEDLDLQTQNVRFEQSDNKAEPDVVSQPMTAPPNVPLETLLDDRPIRSLCNILSTSGQDVAHSRINIQDSNFSAEKTSVSEALEKVPLCDQSNCPRDISEESHMSAEHSISPPAPNLNVQPHSEPPLDSYEFEADAGGLGYYEGIFEAVKQTLIKQTSLASPPLSAHENKRLLKKSGSIRNMHKVPLLLDLPFIQFPKEMEVVERSPLSSNKNIKKSLRGKFSKGTQDIASDRLPGFPNKYSVTGRASLSVRVIADYSFYEQVSLRCSCNLKAMSMCKGCGSFCHNDCIGPSELCVLCLVIR
ncbi:LOW QUALITY PROTEIN: polycomb group protein ASXL1 [Pelodytes ibericus]